MVKKKKKFLTLTLGEGFKVRPKLVRINNRWHPVDPKQWNLVREIEVGEVKKRKKKVKKLM